jgi:hypothetical protein
VRTARKRLDDDVDHVRAAAFFMSSPTAKQFRDAMTQLDKDVNEAHDDATLRQVHSQIQTSTTPRASGDSSPPRRVAPE